MAAQTITTPVNHDTSSVSGLLDGEQYTINGTILTVNADVRWGQNAAVLGVISISSSLGGSFSIDGTTVWEITYSASTGTVPVLAALGSNGIIGETSGATGELFRVWATGSLTPATAGGTMPATGWIKLRTKTGTFTSGEIVTLPGGATITISSTGQRSWIHVVGAEATAITVPRLGSFTTRGDWYSLGTTSGAGNQTLQYPVADICPAIQIETSAGSGIYEWWLHAGSRWNVTPVCISQDVRGKYFGCTSGGVITLALTGANACGMLPASGCNIRIPNILISNSTSAAWATNTMNATIGSRWHLTTTAAGVIDIQYTIGSLFLSATSPYSISIINSATLDQISISTTSTTNTLSNVAIGLSAAVDTTGISIGQCFGGGTLTNIRTTRYLSTSSAGGSAALSLTDVSSFTGSNIQAEVFGGASTATRGLANFNAIQGLRANNCTFDGINLIGGNISVSVSTSFNILNVKYADLLIGTTTSTTPSFAVTFASGAISCSIDGFSAYGGLTSLNPYSGVISYASTVGFEARNIGSYTTNYDCGGATNGAAYIGTGVTSTNATFRRIYCVNIRTAPFQTFSSSFGLTLENVQGDYAQTQLIGNNSALVKGARWTPSTTASSAVYGRILEDGFTSNTAGYLQIMCNEPTSAAPHAVITAGTPKFTSGGQVLMATLGDQVVWTMPYFAIGHNGLTTLTTAGTNTSNLTYEFQVDLGAGYGGTWITLNNTSLSAIGAITSSTGFKMMIRATTATAAANNLLTYIRLTSTSTISDQNLQYSLPVESYSLFLTGLQSGSEVRIYRSSDMTELSGSESSTATYTYTYSYIGSIDVIIVVFALGWQAIRLPYTIGRADASIPFQQTIDRVYSNP